MPDHDEALHSVDVEAFRLVNLQTIGLTQEDNPAITRPQIALVLMGQPAFLTAQAVKTYQTYLDPATAVALGTELVEVGRELGNQAPTTSPGGLEVATSMSQADALARQAEQATRHLRG